MTFWIITGRAARRETNGDIIGDGISFCEDGFQQGPGFGFIFIYVDIYLTFHTRIKTSFLQVCFGNAT